MHFFFRLLEKVFLILCFIFSLFERRCANKFSGSLNSWKEDILKWHCRDTFKKKGGKEGRWEKNCIKFLSLMTKEQEEAPHTHKNNDTAITALSLFFILFAFSFLSLPRKKRRMKTLNVKKSEQNSSFLSFNGKIFLLFLFFFIYLTTNYISQSLNN